jgi:hypothetical protein
MLKQKLQLDQIAAMKAREQVKLDTIRYVIAQIKNKEINTQKELDDNEIVQILQKTKKELNESISSFQKGGRQDLVEEYQKQLDIILTYLPPELSDAELESAVKSLFDQNKEAIAKNPKAIIGIAMKELKGKVDPSRIVPMIRKVTGA